MYNLWKHLCLMGQFKEKMKNTNYFLNSWYFRYIQFLSLQIISYLNNDFVFILTHWTYLQSWYEFFLYLDNIYFMMLKQYCKQAVWLTIFLTKSFIRLSESLSEDSSATLAWLNGLQLLEHNLMHLFVSGLLLSHRESEVRLAALRALTSSRASLATSHNLTMLLYQLGRERWPDNQLALLRALPSTATDKVCFLSTKNKTILEQV